MNRTRQSSTSTTKKCPDNAVPKSVQTYGMSTVSYEVVKGIIKPILIFDNRPPRGVVTGRDGFLSNYKSIRYKATTKYDLHRVISL